mgnify:CR=1 FL=1
MTPWRQAFLSWATTIAFAGFYLSEYLAHRIEGRLATSSESAVAGLVLLSIAVSIVVTFRAASSVSAASDDEAAPSSRRRFLGAALGSVGGVAATVGAAVIAIRVAAPRAAARPYRVRNRVRDRVRVWRVMRRLLAGSPASRDDRQRVGRRSLLLLAHPLACASRSAGRVNAGLATLA